MVDPFTLVIERLRDLGFFRFFLPFLLSSSIFYGLLRKTRLFGDPDRNIAVNAVVSLSIAFMIWASPIILGINLEQQLARFFVQGMIGTLFILFGLMGVGTVFEKGLGEQLSEKWKGGALYVAIVIVGILGGAVILATSGLMEVFFPSGVGLGAVPTDILLAVGMMVILAITVIAIVAIGRIPPKEEKRG